MNLTGNVRTYVNDPQQSQAEIAKIEKMLRSGKVRPLLAFDTESMPRPGLEAYPTTLKGAIDENPKRIHYLRWFMWVTERYFDTEAMREAGAPVPNKTGGKYAKPQWKAFYDRMMNGHGKRYMYKNSELDYRYWEHVLGFIVEGRKKDPVNPGLEPADTDIFAVQYTLQDAKSDKLYSWVFNCAKVDTEVAFQPLNVRGITVIGQNLKFDLGHVMNFYRRKYPAMSYQEWACKAPRNVFCTQVADTILTLGIKGSHSLDTLTKKHLGLEMSKEVRSSFVGVRRDELTEQQIKYSFVDTEVLIPLYDVLIAKSHKSDQEHLLHTFSKLSWITAVWQTNGYTISSERWLQLTDKSTSLRDEYAARLEELLLGEAFARAARSDNVIEEDDNVNVYEDEDNVEDVRTNVVLKISQTAVVARMAMELLGFTPDELTNKDKTWVSEKTGIMSLGKDVRSQIEHYYTEIHGHTHPFFEYYGKWVAYAKMASTYGASFLHWIHPITGKVQASFRIAGTETARYASTSPNFLNLPRGDMKIDVRSAILADVDFLIGGADFSAFEMRAAAALSEDPALLKIFENGIDMHAGAAILAFHIRKDKLVSEPKKITEKFKVGPNEFDSQVWLVPDGWTNDQVLEFALSKEGLSALLKVQKFNDDGTPKLDENGNTVWEKPTRQLAKIVNFLIIFGGSAHTLAAKTNIPLEQAEKVIEAYYEAFPKLIATIREWEILPFDQNLRQLADGRYIGFIEGRGKLRRYFTMPVMPGRHRFPADEEGEKEYLEAKKKYRKQQGAIRRQAFNLGPQGGNALVTAEALLEVIELGLPYGILPWISVYDEIKVLVPIGLVEYDENNNPRCDVYSTVLSGPMICAATKYFPEVGFEADADPLTEYWRKF